MVSERITMDIPYEKMPANEVSAVEFNNAPIENQSAPVRIRHYFGFSLFSAICLCPATGLIALAYSLKSSAKADVKFHDKARLYSRRALIWNWISVIFAVLSTIMVILFCYSMTKTIQLVEDFDRNRYVQPAYSQSNTDDIQKIIQSLTNN